MKLCAGLKPPRTARYRTGTAHSLCDVLDRVLAQGAVASGEITLSLAGVDLVYLNLKLLIASSARLLEGKNTPPEVRHISCN